MSLGALSPEELESLRRLLVISRGNPDIFIRHVLRVPRLRKWQQDLCNEIAARYARGDRRLKVLTRTCHGAGKTFFAAALLLWYMVTRHNSRGLTTAPTWTGVESLLWPEINRLYKRSLIRQAGFGRCLTTKLDFGETWFAVGGASDKPENLEGQHSDTAAIRIVDEAKAVEKEVFEATEGLLNSPESFDLWISTPSIQTGKFYERDQSDDPGVIRAVVDVDQLINDPNLLPKEREGYASWRAECVREFGGEDSPEFQSRVMARYVDNAEGALFPFSWIERAMAHEWSVASGPRVAGLDPAGSKDGDQSALAVAFGPDGDDRQQVLSIKGWYERDTMKTKGLALAGAREANAERLRVDVIGLGKGIGDAARTNEFAISVEEYMASEKAHDPTRFVNRKAEDAWNLRAKMEKGLVRLPKEHKLKSQMASMKYEINQAGKIKFVDPPDSPDLADAVIIATAQARVGYAAVYSEDM